MKGIVSALFVAVVMSGFAVQAAEITQTSDVNESYVVEPVFEANNWRCPRKNMKVIAKYCWDGVYNSYTRCGYICHPDSNIGSGGGTPPVP